MLAFDPIKQEPQRLIISATGLLMIAACLVSRIYFGGPGGFIAPFLAPALLFPIGQLPAALAVFWASILVVGLVAWFKPSRLLAYSFLGIVILLVFLGEVAAYQLVHGE